MPCKQKKCCKRTLVVTDATPAEFAEFKANLSAYVGERYNRILFVERKEILDESWGDPAWTNWDVITFTSSPEEVLSLTQLKSRHRLARILQGTTSEVVNTFLLPSAADGRNFTVREARGIAKPEELVIGGSPYIYGAAFTANAARNTGATLVSSLPEKVEQPFYLDGFFPDKLGAYDPESLLANSFTAGARKFVEHAGELGWGTYLIYGPDLVRLVAKNKEGVAQMATNIMLANPEDLQPFLTVAGLSVDASSGKVTVAKGKTFAERMNFFEREGVIG